MTVLVYQSAQSELVAYQICSDKCTRYIFGKFLNKTMGRLWGFLPNLLMRCSWNIVSNSSRQLKLIKFRLITAYCV